AAQAARRDRGKRTCRGTRVMERTLSGSENDETSGSGFRLTVRALVACSVAAVGLVAATFVIFGMDLSIMRWLRRVAWVFWPAFWVVMAAFLSGWLVWAEKRRLAIELLMVGGMVVGWASGVVGFGVVMVVSDGATPRDVGLIDVATLYAVLSYLALTWV